MAPSRFHKPSDAGSIPATAANQTSGESMMLEIVKDASFVKIPIAKIKGAQTL